MNAKAWKGIEEKSVGSREIGFLVWNILIQGKNNPKLGF